MKIIGGPSSQTLACRVAAQLQCTPTVTDYVRFPDNEQYLKISDDVDGQDVLIIQNTTTDSDLIALLQLLDACETAKKINIVIPYMGYSRQDKLFNKGEAVSARAMAKTIAAESLDSVFTVNLHDRSILNHFTCPAADLDASPLIGKFLSDLNLKKPLLIAPDKGAKRMVENMAAGLSLDHDVFEKTRFSGDTVAIKEKEMDIKGRDVIIVDDMIATGGTIAEAVKILYQNGAKDIYAACVHPVLTRNAVLRLANAGVKDIISTDTIEKIQSRISVAPLIAGALKK